MRIFADENIGTATVQQLRDEGHFVTWVIEGGRGSTDPKVLSSALEANSLLITNDKDFGELVFRHRQHTAGVLLLRIHDLPYSLRAKMVLAAIHAEGESLLDKFSVLTPSGIRSREI